MALKDTFSRISNAIFGRRENEDDDSQEEEISIASLNATVGMKSRHGLFKSWYRGFTEDDPNPLLIGRNSVVEFDKMRTVDVQIAATLLAGELPIRATTWAIDPGKTKNADGTHDVSPKDQEIADFVTYNLFTNCRTSFDDYLRLTLGMLWAGFSIFEKVYEEKQGKIMLKKLADRPQTTIMQFFDNEGNLNISQVNSPNVIPGWKVIIHTFRKEWDLFGGRSAIRPTYQNWTYKTKLYRLDGILHERNSLKVPVITTPDAPSPEELTAAKNIAKNLKSSEGAHVILPGKDWKFEFAGSGSSNADLMKSISHHNREISKAILAQFIELGAEGGGGSYALSEDHSDLFKLGLTAIANGIARITNEFLIRELVDLNFDMADGQEYPTLTFDKIGDLDLTKILDGLSSLAEKNIITPDNSIEDKVRELLDLPKAVYDEEGKVEWGRKTDGSEPLPEETPAEQMDPAEEMDGMDVAPNDQQAIDEETTAIDEMISTFKASEEAMIFEEMGEYLEFADDLDCSMTFASQSAEHKAAIAEGLKRYWDAKGRQKKTINGRNASFKNSAADAGNKIKAKVDELKKTIDPLKKEMERIKSSKMGKREKANALSKIKNQISSLKGAQKSGIDALKSIKSAALQGARQTRETIQKRRVEVRKLIDQVEADFDARKATKVASIQTLKDQIAQNVATYNKLKESATTPEEMKNLRAIYASLKAENSNLRTSAQNIRGVVSSDRKATVKQKRDLRDSVKTFSEEDSPYTGCVMLDLVESQIPKIDIATEDIVMEEDGSSWYEGPHLTLLYGINKNIDKADIMYRIKYEGQPVTIEKMDIFEQEDQDVLIFRVKLELWLDEINGSLGVLDFKNDYPIYNPHITIGYIKKGTGAKYITTDHDGKEIQAKDIILTTEENGTPEILFSQHDIESKIFSELSKHFDPFDMARLSSFIK